MAELAEESFTIPVGAERLHGVWHRTAGDPSAGVVICPPLFEERKSAHRALVETARALAAEGVAVLRFDYRGSGDSGGAFEDFAVTAWQEDIASASAWLSARLGGTRVGWLGLRLGASIAAVSAVGGDTLAPDFLILWEPIVSGRVYLHQLFRQMLMKEMLTYGKGRRTRSDLIAELEDGRMVDADGYALTSRLYRDITALDLLAVSGSVPELGLILHVGTSEESSKPTATFASRLRELGTDATLTGLRMPPFWSLVGFVDYTPIIEKTLSWVRQHGISARHEQSGTTGKHL